MVSAGTGPGVEGGSRGAVRLDPRAGVVPVDGRVDGPDRSVHEHADARVEAERSGDADHAGDAELAGDDRGVAGGTALLGHEREHQARVEARGVGRREIRGHQHGRGLGLGHAGLGLADQPRDQAPFDVQQVGGPLRHEAAHRGEDVDELRHPLVDRPEHRGAALDPGRDRLAQPFVAGQPGAGGEHLGGGTTGPGRLGGEPLRHRSRRRVVRRQRGLGIGVPAVAVRLDRGGRHLLRDQHHRPVREPRHDRRATQRLGGSAVVGSAGAEGVTMATSKTTVSLTVNTFGTKTTYSQIESPPRR